VATSAKDYNLIAAMIRRKLARLDRLAENKSPQAQTYATTGRSAITGVAVELALILANDNPRFDTDRFYAACGLTREDEGEVS
jgi:hypothetical protein